MGSPALNARSDSDCHRLLWEGHMMQKTLGHPSALSLDGLPDSENPSLLLNLELEHSGTEGQRGSSSVELGV